MSADKANQQVSESASWWIGVRLWGIPAVLLLAFALRMVCIQGRALWYDEAFAVLYGSLDPERIIYGTVTPVEGAGAADVHPLFYYFLLHGWMGVVGRSPLAARFLSAIFGMVAVALLWRLAAWCFGRRTGLAVGLLAAINPFHIAYSQEARMYALLGLAAVATTWFLLRALGAGARRRWWILYAVAAACTLYAHNLGAFVLLALHLLVVTGRRWRRQWRQWLLPLALADLIALFLFSPWLVGVLPGQVGFVGRGYWLAAPGARELVHAFMFPVFTFYEPIPLWLLGPAFFVGAVLAVLSAWRAWRMRSRAGWFLLLCWGPVVALWLVSLWRPVYLERALLPSTLFYLIAVGWLLVRGGLPRLLRLGLVGLLALSTAASLSIHYTYARFPRPPFDQLVGLLQARVRAGELVVHDNKLTFFPAHYYGPTLSQTFCPDLPASGSDTLALPTQEVLGLSATPVERVVTGGVEGVWYVAFEQMWDEYRDLGYDDVPNRAWLRAHCRQEGDVYTIADLEVYHFVDCEARP